MTQKLLNSWVFQKKKSKRKLNDKETIELLEDLVNIVEKFDFFNRLEYGV